MGKFAACGSPCKQHQQKSQQKKTLRKISALIPGFTAFPSCALQNPHPKRARRSIKNPNPISQSVYTVPVADAAKSAHRVLFIFVLFLLFAF